MGDISPTLLSTSFVQSYPKKLNSLLEKNVFEMVFILKIPKNTKIFNSYFVDEITNIEIANTFHKSRQVI